MKAYVMVLVLYRNGREATSSTETYMDLELTPSVRRGGFLSLEHRFYPKGRLEAWQCRR